jgi:hypothetical protein
MANNKREIIQEDETSSVEEGNPNIMQLCCSSNQTITLIQKVSVTWYLSIINHITLIPLLL